MKHSQKRTCWDIRLIHKDEFRDFCRNENLSSFTRNPQAAMAAPDAWVDIPLDKSRIKHYQGTDIGLRMVKVPLPEDREEVLITNLPSETFDHLKIAQLYQTRWGNETADETLKDRLQIEKNTHKRAY